MTIEIIATIASTSVITVGAFIAGYNRLTNKITKMEEKIDSLEKQHAEERTERKELTRVLHEVSESIALLKGYLEGHAVFQNPVPRTRRSTTPS